MKKIAVILCAALAIVGIYLAVKYWIYRDVIRHERIATRALPAAEKWLYSAKPFLASVIASSRVYHTASVKGDKALQEAGHLPRGVDIDYVVAFSNRDACVLLNFVIALNMQGEPTTIFRSDGRVLWTRSVRQGQMNAYSGCLIPGEAIERSVFQVCNTGDSAELRLLLAQHSAEMNFWTEDHDLVRQAMERK